tara:strand:- start:136 stop:339 length:204 start_codon:yes stop_codon:yes gene_type:complete
MMVLYTSEARVLRKIDESPDLPLAGRESLLGLIDMTRLQDILKCEYVSLEGHVTEAGRRAYQKALAS